VRRNVQFKIERTDFIEPAAVTSLHRTELRCSCDLCDEDFTLGEGATAEPPDHSWAVMTNGLDALGGSSLFKRFE
jgi:hypothetical protein